MITECGFSKAAFSTSIGELGLHLQPAKLFAIVTENIDGVTYTAKRERVIHCEVSRIEQTEICEELANQCSIENRMNAKLFNQTISKHLP